MQVILVAKSRVLIDTPYVDIKAEENTKIQTIYADGKTPQTISVYNDDGKLMQTKNFINGLQVDSIEFDNNGAVDTKTFYTDEHISGFEDWNDGTLVGRNTYDDSGNVTGKYELFANGDVKAYESWQDKQIVSRFTYSESGRVDTKTFYQDSQKIKFEDWDEGKKIEVNTYDKLQKVDTKTFYQDGRKIKFEDWSDGELVKRKTFYQNGKTKAENIYKNNKIERIINFDESGSKKSKQIYEGGKLHYEYKYKPSGEYTKTYYIPSNGRKVYTEKWEIVKGSLKRTKIQAHVKPSIDAGYQKKSRDACDLSGTRAKNAVVDIGYDSDYANRIYYAYTDKYGRIKKVEAAVIIRQAQTIEQTVFGANGTSDELRYCYDEAKVTGAVGKYNEGHVIADSLGGVSNAYNITPEIGTVNLYGGQYKMEEEIRTAIKSGSVVTNFTMRIAYERKSAIPSKYSATYYIDGKRISRTFENK